MKPILRKHNLKLNAIELGYLTSVLERLIHTRDNDVIAEAILDKIMAIRESWRKET